MHLFILTTLLQYCLQVLDVQSINLDYYVIWNFKRHFNVEHVSVQNLMCQSVTVTAQELSPTSLECLSLFSLVDSGTSGELGVEGEHTVQFFIQIQKGRPSETVSRSSHSSFYMADQQTHLSLTVESAACLIPGHNAVYGMNGLVFIFCTIGIPKDY